MDRNARNRVDASLWCFSFAVLFLAKSRLRCQASDESSNAIHQPGRVWGPTLEHRFSRFDAPVSIPSTHVAARATVRAARRISVQRRCTRTCHLRSSSRGLRRSDAILRDPRAGIVVERSRFGRRIGLGSGWQGRAFMMLVLIAPVFFLFHRPFVIRVIVPFMQAIGALR